MSEKTLYICFPARKGGVGKTMFVANTAAYLANDGKRVLVVCTDPQEDLSEKYLTALEDYDIDEHLSLADVLSGESVEKAIVTTPSYNGYDMKRFFYKRRRNGKTYTFDIIPSGVDIDSRRGDDLNSFRNVLCDVEKNYDYILFDTPPSESEAFMMTLMSCDYAVVPVTDLASFKSVQMVLDDIELAKENGSPIQCLGIVINNQHTSRKLDHYNEDLFRESMGGLVFDTVVRSSSSIPNADAFSVPLCSFEQTSNGHEDFYRYYCEFVKRLHS